MIVKALTPKNFNKQTLKVNHKDLKGKKGMVVCIASWCGYCKQFMPLYKDISSTLGKSFPMFYLDCVKYSEFAQKDLKVKGFPTIFFIGENTKPRQYLGPRTEEALLSSIINQTRTNT